MALDKVGPGQEDVSIMIRPDHFRLHNGEDALRLNGTVTDTTYLGEYTQLSVLTPWGGPLSVRLPPDDRASPVEKGQSIALTCAPLDVRAF